MTPPNRAEPLSPDERRRAIVDAIIPLLVERGGYVTTKQMAEAAGVAEGTIFKVFPDKAAVILEALKVSMDPDPVRRALAEIYQGAPLEVQLAEAARILLERFETTLALLTILKTMPVPAERRPPGPPPFVVVSNAAINEALTSLFERHRDQLRVEPARAATAFRGLVLASGHPAMALSERLSIDEVVQVVLFGILSPKEVRV